jgi:hypothetical protein
MLTKLTALFTLLPVALTSPPPTYYPYPNTTNATYPTGSGTGTGVPTPTFTPLPVACETFYPSELRILSSRYPSYEMSPLHGRTGMFMLLRQRPDTFQTVTQLQFTLPATYAANTSNATCHLHLHLPQPSTQTITGPQPIFNLYQVAREAGAPATWDMFDAKDVSAGGPEPKVFGQVNGTAEARDKQRAEKAGVYDIGPTCCNETLTWQMGMAFDGGDEVNYWNFLNVRPPAVPEQGFRLVTGPEC